ncbi:HelD family protein [Aeromicrobium alkaliterrae]|uniref:AAA family ATPase n=1 Tax=Aeromicrobium alkaliterrae TaxID=302168 RepID=A0ABN2JZE5_9ACTN
MTSPAAAQREIASEQSYVDTVYERLDASADVARALVKEGFERGHVGHEGGLVERDAMVFQATRRLTALNAAHDGLVFGRLDLGTGEPRYIGRIGVRDAEREILLIDWRAPAASVFYQATAADPAGVVRRRVLRCSGSTVIGIEDDLLDAESAPADMVVVGEGALLASMSRARDARMHSVVATIQKEQDDAIRAPSRGATIIGGGPGTGKTVVALHRAAYLLYTDRRRFESGGVLVVGPSGVFMAYIERVLPSLGETSVTLRSLGEVVDGVKAARHDEPVAAAAKGSQRMVRVLRRLATEGSPETPTSFRYFYKDDVLRLDEKRLAGLRRHLLQQSTYNRVVPRAPAVLADALWQQVRGERAREEGREGFLDVLVDDHRFVDFVEAWWPERDAVDLWRSLPARIAEIAHGAFRREELDALRASWDGQPPSIEDVPLIDELRYLLGEVPPRVDEDVDVPKQLMSFERREREDVRSTRSIEDDGYAHVLIDEAQDLSPMQWRMVGRRGRHASWTIVGDAAQSSWPVPAEAEQARVDALEGKPEHRFRLSTNYRNSAEIYDLAADVARRAIPGADLADGVRRTGEQPAHLEVPAAGIATAVREEAEKLLGRVEGSVAVVAPLALRPLLERELATTLASHDRLRLLDALETKGLEFDAVIAAEPDVLIGESEAGWRTFYVVLTRATQLLTTVGSTSRWRTEEPA